MRYIWALLNITRGRTSTVAFQDCRTFLCHRFDSLLPLPLSLSLSPFFSLILSLLTLLLSVRLAQTLWLLHHAGLWHCCVHLDSFFLLLFSFFLSLPHVHLLAPSNSGYAFFSFVLPLMASLENKGERKHRDRYHLRVSLSVTTFRPVF